MTFDPYSSDYFDGQEQAEERIQKRFANAVKALIVHKNKLLILKNALDDPNRPGEPDFPGGRLELGENPYTGLIRELAEELGPVFAEGSYIGRPVDVNHFERDDGQTVTMIFFECFLGADKEIVLSPEHSSFEWVPLKDAEKGLYGKQAGIMLRAVRALMVFDHYEE